MFERFDGFSYSPAIPFEMGVTRRDPSPVVRVGDCYYVWYSRTEQGADGYSATVWYATSPDGHVWTEIGEALGRGAAGSFDEHAVFTPTILAADGSYFLFYTAVPEPFTNDGGGPGGTRTAIGVAVADRPEGPWRRHDANPVLRPGDDPGDFDSHRTDDACLLMRDGAYWLYYKGRQERRTPGQTKMGVAVSASPCGPFRKFDGNPVLGSGHEVCVWPHGKGVGCIVAPTGPEGATLQYSCDGIRFRPVRHISPPKAPGPFRADNFREGAGPGITWGISMETGEDPHWPFLVRFDVNLAAQDEELR
jgi:beta-xylosidase